MVDSNGVVCMIGVAEFGVTDSISGIWFSARVKTTEDCKLMTSRKDSNCVSVGWPVEFAVIFKPEIVTSSADNPKLVCNLTTDFTYCPSTLLLLERRSNTLNREHNLSVLPFQGSLTAC